MIQCDKLLALGLAERRDVLEKSGLCMFCLKHSAEFDCYGRGGLSKPRCTRDGCDGEHTPNLHLLMSGGDGPEGERGGPQWRPGRRKRDRRVVRGGE